MKKSPNIIVLYLLNIILPMLVGVMIYILFRRNTYINVLFGYSPSYVQRSFVVDFISFYLVDALWAYALTFSLSIFLNEYLSAIISAAFGAVWELCQKRSIVSGTFDVLDIIMYLAASGLAVIIICFIKRRKRL